MIENDLTWCIENINNSDLCDDVIRNKYEQATKFLLTHKLGFLSEDEAKIIVKFFAIQTAINLEVIDIVDIKIMSSDEYENNFKCSSIASCVKNENGKYDITYSPKTMSYIMRDECNSFMRGIQVICHEIVHVFQNKIINKEKLDEDEIVETVYIMALETIVRRHDLNFYDKNYKHLLKENHAERIGLKLGLDLIKKYHPNLYKLYSHKKIQTAYQKYDDNFYKADMEIAGKSGFAINQLDLGASIYIAHNPEVLNEFPILTLAYNEDGKKKNIKQLLEQRRALLTRCSKQTIDELYYILANQKNFFSGGLNGANDEIRLICEYLYKYLSNDVFIFDLLEYRMEKLEIPETTKRHFFEQLNLNIQVKKEQKLYSEKRQAQI